MMTVPKTEHLLSPEDFIRTSATENWSHGSEKQHQAEADGALIELYVEGNDSLLNKQSFTIASHRSNLKAIPKVERKLSCCLFNYYHLSVQ